MKDFRIMVFCTITIFLFLDINSISAQQINHLAGNKYEYEGSIYKYPEMGQIFQSDSLSYKHYKLAIKKKKLVIFLSVISATSIGGVFLGRQQVKNGDPSGYGLMFIGVIGSFSTILAIDEVLSNNKHKRKSIDIFNQSIGHLTPKKQAIDLSLVFNGSIGLQLRF